MTPEVPRAVFLSRSSILLIASRFFQIANKLWDCYHAEKKELFLPARKATPRMEHESFNPFLIYLNQRHDICSHTERKLQKRNVCFLILLERRNIRMCPTFGEFRGISGNAGIILLFTLIFGLFCPGLAFSETVPPSPPRRLGLTELAGISKITSNVWESVPIRTSVQKQAGLSSGEGFQYVHAITYAPSDPSIVYLSVDTSQVWKSIDGGFSWESKNNGFVVHGARSIIVDPINADIVFAAGFLGPGFERAQKYEKRLQGIYRTIDGGETWAFVRATDFYKQKSKGCLFAFNTCSSENNRTPIIFAGSYNEGLLCSEDGGDTWHIAGFNGKQIIDMKENPSKPGELFVGTDDGLYLYSKKAIKKIGTGLPDWPRSIAVSPQNPKVLYAAVGTKGAFKSRNAGIDFVSAGKGLPENIDFTDIAVSPVNSDIVYLKAHKSGHYGKPFFSHDGAKSWHTPESTDLGNLLDGQGFWFSSPFAPHPREAMTALTVSNGRARIRKTLDGGKNWAYSGTGFTGARMRDIVFSKDGKMIFCLTDHGAWLTEDSGDTFREFPVQRIFGQKSSYAGAISGGTIVISLGTWGKKGLAVSHDLGESWKNLEDLVDDYKFVGIHPKYNNIIYAGPYRSRNTGDNWEKLAQTIRAMYSENGDIVYSVSPEGEKEFCVLKSIDQGETWLKPYPVCHFSAESVQDVAIAPDDPNRIYLATSFGVWVYDGTKWLLRNDENGLDRDFFGMRYIGSVSVDPNNPSCVYVGRLAPGHGQSNGVFRSMDRGMTWENITFNLGPELSVWSVKISPIDSTVYIGTSLGTWKYKNR